MGRWLRSPVARAVATFTVAGVVALVAVALGSSAASRHAATDTAIGDARRDASLLARTAIGPTLQDSLFEADRFAVASMDAEVRARILDRDLVRVKLWRQDGAIVYSDEPRLIGSRYALGQDERSAFRTGSAAADVSDLSQPENRFERPFGKLLEVYQPVRLPDGRPLLFEAYFRYDAVTASGQRVWSDFAPFMVGALVGLEALQIPLAWSMARRLRSGQDRQERLLRRAIESSEAERRRIARDLHDGVVQDLASVSYALASVEGTVTEADRAVLHEAAAGTRRSIRSLRSLLVELYPPSLRDAGLVAALSDLAAPLPGHGIEIRLGLSDDLRLPQDVEALVFRAAQEALRNVVAHAGATRVDIHLSRPDHRAVLDVNDNGTGFDMGTLSGGAGDGHVGLRVLAELAEELGGALVVRSAPGRGTAFHLEVPLR